MDLPYLQLVRKLQMGSTTNTWVLSLVTLGALLVLAGCGTGSTPTKASVAPGAASTTETPTHPAGTGTGEDWTTYHRDNVRSGYLPDMPDPQQLAVAWNTQLDGAVYAEPLVVGGQVIVATENNSLYSLNA